MSSASARGRFVVQFLVKQIKRLLQRDGSVEPVTQHSRHTLVAHETAINNTYSPSIRYPVRMALVNLDDAPAWFTGQARDHMSAADARAMAGTDGA